MAAMGNPAIERILRKRAEKEGPPKTFLHGAVRGATSIVGGALAGVAVVVAAPVVGLARGGLGGLVAGTVAGAIGGVILPVAGVLSGTGQVISGVFNTPGTVAKFAKESVAPEKGHDKLGDDELESVIEEDERARAQGRSEVRAAAAGEEKAAGEWPDSVKETGLYDLLAVKPSATRGEIKRAYYKLARELHPDKNSAEDAKTRFQAVSNAYQVLSDDGQRRTYNAHGAKGLEPAFLEAATQFEMMFGSAKFEHLTGQLAAAATAVEPMDAAQFEEWQKKREHDLAHLLRARVMRYVDGDIEGFVRQALDEAEKLRAANFGQQLLNVVGHTYKAKALMLLGRRGVFGWVSGGFHDARESMHDAKSMATAVKSAMEVAELQQRMQSGQLGNEEAEEKARAELQERTVSAVWAVTVLDIESTLREVVSQVVDRKGLSKDDAKQRARAIIVLGKIFLYAASADYSKEKADAKFQESK